MARTNHYYENQINILNQIIHEKGRIITQLTNKMNKIHHGSELCAGELITSATHLIIPNNECQPEIKSGKENINTDVVKIIPEAIEKITIATMDRCPEIFISETKHAVTQTPKEKHLCSLLWIDVRMWDRGCVVGVDCWRIDNINSGEVAASS